jgi:hypothetical protein
MAPEFFPIFAFLGLAVIALTGLCVGVVRAILTRRVPRLLCSVVAVAVLLLLILGMSIRQQYFLNEPFASACGGGDIAEAQRLLLCGASPDAYGIDFRETALIAASRYGNREIVEFLLRNGANVDLMDSYGKTALQRAKEAGHGDIVRLIEQAEETRK